MSDQITFDDCCRLILEQGAPPHDHPTPDKSDYRRDLLAVLNKEFGIDWNDTDEFPPKREVAAITSSLVRAYNGIADPFFGWLEYTPVKGEGEVLHMHQAGICNAATDMRQRFVALFRDLLLLRWPKAADRISSWTRLRSLGIVVPVYDRDDF
jgi:hypothetical protein